MKKMTAVILLGGSLFAFGADAQDTSKQDVDPLDLSKFQVVRPGENLPTVETVAALEKEANDLFASGDCETALPKIVDYYTAANMLANIIRRGVQPYYGAGYDDKKGVNLGSDLQDLVVAENTSNSYIGKRNVAWVMEAECLVKLGKHDEAVASLFRALDYISIKPEDRALWKKARDLLWAEVNFSPK